MRRVEYNTAEIMFLSGDVNYSEIYLIDGKKMLTSTTLSKHEERLDKFVRVNKKYLVNPKFVTEYRIEGRYMHITMTNGDHMKVSRRRVKNVLLSIVAV